METINEEEMKEQLAEEMAKYEEEGYFKRLLKMFSGLGRPCPASRHSLAGHRSRNPVRGNGHGRYVRAEDKGRDYAD